MPQESRGAGVGYNLSPGARLMILPTGGCRRLDSRFTAVTEDQRITLCECIRGENLIRLIYRSQVLITRAVPAGKILLRLYTQNIFSLDFHRVPPMMGRMLSLLTL